MSPFIGILSVIALVLLLTGFFASWRFKDPRRGRLLLSAGGAVTAVTFIIQMLILKG